MPVLVSIPHGGMETPPELRDSVRLDEPEIFEDIDPFTGEIYDLDGAVDVVVKARIARTFVDLNRAPDDQPPANPDGVVKSHTCFERQIYRTGRSPDAESTRILLERYHAPYHRRLEEAAQRPGVRLALDCHSMLATAPPIAPRPGEPRPHFCLSNRNGLTCPAELMTRLARALAVAFDCSLEEVRLNDPFQGGYIIRRHGVSDLPWIQLEMNRSWYLAAPWFDRDALTVDPARIEELRDRMHRALTLLDLPDPSPRDDVTFTSQ